MVDLPHITFHNFCWETIKKSTASIPSVSTHLLSQNIVGGKLQQQGSNHIDLPSTLCGQIHTSLHYKVHI